MPDSSEQCRRFLRDSAAGLHDEETMVSWLPHIQECRRCRQAWQSYQQMLHILRRAPAPPLPVDFRYRVQRRLRGATDAGALGRRAKWGMRLYWAAASLTGFYISSRISWPQELPASKWIVLTLIGLGMAAPVLGILRNPGRALRLALRMLG